jgi:vancomycin aglycone glucosyltransferase
MRKLLLAGMHDTVREQFQVLAEAARGCDLIMVCGGVQSAGGSIAELYKIPYVFATYCPLTLPSPHHPPPMIRNQALPKFVNSILWLASEYTWNKVYRDAVNTQRAGLGLPSVRDIPRYMITAHPWVAADPVLAPAAPSTKLRIRQTGAWLLRDSTPLPAELVRFLAAGEPPVYVGIGSMRAAARTGDTLVQAVRSLGRRAILSRGWGDLGLNTPCDDCIVISDVAHEQLFPHVAAIVHHGGAGTTTVAARAGKPQVVVPHLYDQYYWSHRVHQLGIGVSGPKVSNVSISTLADALRNSLTHDMAVRAQAFAGRISLQGARIAAEELVAGIGNI